MRIALVDDDQIMLDSLNGLLHTALNALGVETECIDRFLQPSDFLFSWHPGDYDLILLDIYMGQENGVALAKTIRQSDRNVLLAFCTSSNEFASESYEVGAVYYLQKPVDLQKLTAMLQRLYLSQIKRNRMLTLPDGFRCLLRHILYTEYSNHTVTFHLLGADPHKVYMNHAQAEDLLLHYPHFCCINKGCIVNFSMASKITASEFLMKNGEALPISRRRYKDVYSAYNQFHFDRMAEEVE